VNAALSDSLHVDFRKPLLALKSNQLSAIIPRQQNYYILQKTAEKTKEEYQRSAVKNEYWLQATNINICRQDCGKKFFIDRHETVTHQPFHDRSSRLFNLSKIIIFQLTLRIAIVKLIFITLKFSRNHYAI